MEVDGKILFKFSRIQLNRSSRSFDGLYNSECVET